MATTAIDYAGIRRAAAGGATVAEIEARYGAGSVAAARRRNAGEIRRWDGQVATHPGKIEVTYRSTFREQHGDGWCSAAGHRLDDPCQADRPIGSEQPDDRVRIHTLGVA